MRLRDLRTLHDVSRFGNCQLRHLMRKLTTRERMPHPVQFSISEKLLHCNEKRFRGGLVFKARRLLYHSNLGRE